MASPSGGGAGAKPDAEGGLKPGDFSALRAQLGIALPDALLDTVFTHSSFKNESPGTVSNQRLEFLGDAIIDAVVAEELYRRLPEAAEGKLTQIRAHCVSDAALAGIADTLKLGQYLRLGKGAESEGGAKNASNLAAAFEALAGAIFLHCGFETCARIIKPLFERKISEASKPGAILDYKVALQWAGRTIVYTTSELQTGGRKVFKAVLTVDGKEYTSSARKKKDAEQAAAKAAYEAVTEASAEAARSGSSSGGAGADSPDK